MTTTRTLLAALIALAAAAPSALAADAAHPAVVELFTSQGCSSCPPANANVAALAGRPDVLALSFGVTYWDQLGWKDTFARPEFTERQYAYARALGRGAGTPEVVVDGRSAVVGFVRAELEALIRRSDLSHGPALRLSAGEVIVGAAQAPARAADVWLVRYDPRTVQVPVQRGENGGRTLPHHNVVRQLIRLGRWSGAAQSYRLPAPVSGLSTAVLVQTTGLGPILAAARG